MGRGRSVVRVLIAACCVSDPNLGVPGVMHALAEQYRDMGHEVRLSFRRGGGRLEEMLFGIRLAVSADARWAQVVDSHAVDAWPLCLRPKRPVVVARSHGLELVVHRKLLAARERGEPVRIHPVYWTYRGTARLAFERSAIRRSDAAFVLNASDRGICLDEFGADPAKVLQVPNGVPVGFLRRPLPDAAGLAFVGSWLHRKGADLVVRSLSRILEADPDQDLLLAGAGAGADVVLRDFPEHVRPMVRIRERFRREELPDVLAGRGILLFPSRSEGYPLSLAESMALGLVPVASAIPGVVELVEHGRDGILFPPEDWNALADSVIRLRRDPALLAALRSGAREKMRSTGWDAVARDQAAVCERLLAARKGRI